VSAEIHVLPIRRQRETPKHIQRIIRDIDSALLKSEIKICTPPGNLDKIIEARIQGKVFLLRRLIDCGKHCRGCPHGPYWYGFYRSKGSFVSFYLGKKLPPRFESATLIKISPKVFPSGRSTPTKEGGDKNGSKE
jgi:hypothetical protein